MDFAKDLQLQVLGYYDDLISILPKLGIGLIVMGIFLLVVRILRKKLVKYINTKADDKLIANFTDNIIRIINFLLAIFLFLYVIGQSGLAGSLLGAATVSSLVLGFAFKDIGENFLAGVIMAFSRPFRLGDTIKTGEVEGKILEMSLRETHIKTFDGKDVYVPNGQILKNPLYNYTIDGFLRKQFTLGLDYGTNIDEAREIILETMKTIPGILNDEKPPSTLIQDFGPSTVNIRVLFWINTFDTQYSSVEVQSQAMNKVLKAMADAEIGMPGDIIELKNYNNEPIKTGMNQTA